MNFQKIIFFLIFLLVIDRSIFAVNQNTNLAVSVTVNDVCTIAANPLDFGIYNPLSGANLDAQTTIDVTCTLNTPYTIASNAGIGIGASIATRKLTNGGSTINYSLYSDALHTALWGNGGGQLIAGNGTGVVQAITVYGRIAASQNVVTGNYADTVQVTVTY